MVCLGSKGEMNMDKLSPITYGAAVAAAEEILANASGVTDAVITEKTNSAVKLYLADNRPIFDTFPNEVIIVAMKDDSTFETRGFYEVGDGAECMYLVTSAWKPNSILVGTKYVIPLLGNDGEIKVQYFGIRTGEEYADFNSTIITSILNRIDFGSVLKFPTGHFYFSSTIDLTTGKKQLSLIGSGSSFTSDENTSGMTWLHFPTLAENGVGIAIGTGTLKDIIVCGNSTSYSCSLDRTKTYTASDSIVTETATIKAYGIKGGTMTTITNVAVMYFYWGMYINTNNVYITDVNFRSCHYGLTVGNDIKIKGLYGWNVMILLQIRGSISSVNQVRGDSIGLHLVEIASGSGVNLSDLDADYCIKSVVKIGDDATWTTHSSIVINGIHGRACVGKTYDVENDPVPSAQDITADTLHDYPLISIAAKTTVQGLAVTCGNAGGANPLDKTSNYLTPNILLCAGANSKLQGAVFNMADATIALTKDWLMQKIHSLSTYSDCVQASINADKGCLYYKKSYETITASKATTEDI